MLQTLKNNEKIMPGWKNNFRSTIKNTELINSIMSITIIGIEEDPNECPQCGSTENEMIEPDGICYECWIENHM
ncbi:hypothetical protein GCM10022259_22380 [Aquimarina mytili]